MTALRQEVRYQRLQEAAETEEQEEVTVQLYSPSFRPVARAHCREAALRICSALLLLTVAIGFFLYELEYGGVGPPENENSHGRPPWNISIWESSSANQKSEDLEEIEEHEDHQQKDGSIPAGHSHSAGTYHHGAVVTDSESCSEAARDVLRAGGSVVDAGAAAVLCLAVVHSHSVSLGGIFSSIYFNGTARNASVLNAIPRNLSSSRFGVPLVLQGLWTLHQGHGRKPWAQLFSPAIRLARQGFSVESSLHEALEKDRKKSWSSEGLRGLFYHHKVLKAVGASVVNEPLGHSLEIAQTMNTSALPELLLHNLLQDLQVPERDVVGEALTNLQLRSEDPVELRLEGLTLFSSAAPTAGAILARSVQDVYEGHMSEASVYELLTRRAGVWPPDAGAPSAPVGSSVLVADSAGDVVLIALTLNSTFGSGFVSPSTGILLSDFVLGPGGAVAPGAPSFWACSSVLSSEAEVVGVAAARGGSALPGALARVLLSHVLLQMDLPEAVNRTWRDPKGQNRGDQDRRDPGGQNHGDQDRRDPGGQNPGDQDRRDPGGQNPGDQDSPVLAVQVRAEHVHVATAPACACHPAGL